MNEELISTEDLVNATGYVDKIVEIVREAHAGGHPLDVETLAAMILAGIYNAPPPAAASETIVINQTVLLSIAIQRLAR